ncbi:MAG TPA: IPT/TIG domain-containing protein, partial [Bryobacteraceae bacterium]|nr:IPT/TIG domain-containing protein [Bryobacteraceae bacterium]
MRKPALSSGRSKPRAIALACFTIALSSAAAFAQQPVTVQYVYDDLNRLMKAIDSTGVSIQYVYDSVGDNVQVIRSTVTPGALTIFTVTPASAAPGATVTIQGQGFSSTPGANTVTLNGVALTVVSAAATVLVAQIPLAATSGTISVTVGGITVTSPPEAILTLPVIVSVSPKAVLAGTPFTLTVTGLNLSGTSFFFLPPLPFSPMAIDPSGASATLLVSPPSSTRGYFTLVAGNGPTQSSAIAQVGFLPAVGAFNTISIPGSSGTADADQDGISNAQELTLGTDPLNSDTDGDRYPDGLELAFGSDPLNPASFPLIPNSGPTVASIAFSAGNQTSPAPATQTFTFAEV